VSPLGIHSVKTVKEDFLRRKVQNTDHHI